MHCATLFSYNQQQLATTREEILQSLATYSGAELPVVLRFVFRTSPGRRRRSLPP